MKRFKFSFEYKNVDGSIVTVTETFIKNEYSESYKDEYYYWVKYDTYEPFVKEGYATRKLAVESFNWALKYNGMNDKKLGYNNIQLISAVRK